MLGIKLMPPMYKPRPQSFGSSLCPEPYFLHIALFQGHPQPYSHNGAHRMHLEQCVEESPEVPGRGKLRCWG